MNTHKTPLDDKTRKTRHLLVSFYSPIPLASSNPFSKHTSSDDINSTSFQHDQFMNNLVYSRGTLKWMKSNILGMEENMEQFLEKITVQSRSDSVNPSPYKNREHIEKMYQTCNLLFKIQVKNLKTKLLDKLELSLANIHFIPKIMDNASPCTHELDFVQMPRVWILYVTLVRGFSRFVENKFYWMTKHK
ncbi:hypothetical protein glysoja_002044 [Glycine soja]|nr:hypothetical protein glysoja_002044 [Glycine soja]